MRPLISFSLALVFAVLLAAPANAAPPAAEAPSESMAAFGAALLWDGDALIAGRSGYSARFPAPPSQSGGVYVYVPDGEGGYERVQALIPDDASVGDAFGSVLALGGDLLAIGAPAAQGCGAAYVYERLANGWSLMQRLSPSECDAGTRFGGALALDGDRLFVGAPGSGAGTVYTYDMSGQMATVLGVMVGDADGGGFGSALAADNGMLLVGAPGVADGEGRAYAYRGMDRVEVLRSSESGLKLFGLNVALKNGSALVAAPGMNAAGNTFGVRPQNGAVMAFSVNDYGFTAAGMLQPEDEGRAARGYGTALALTDDGMAWVGAPYADGGRGAIRGYTMGLTGYVLTNTLADGSLSRSDNLGSVLAAHDGRVASAALRAAFGDGRVVVFHQSQSEDTWRVVDGFTETGRDLQAITGEELRCEEDGSGDLDGGLIGEFDCGNVDLVAFLPSGDIGAETGVIVNDIWGWTDPETGREIVIQGRSNGTSFVDITDATNPVYLADVPMTPGSAANAWRDVKVFKNHALIVADNVGPHGLQIFDMARLRPLYDDPSARPATFEPDVIYREVASVHNVVVNEATDFVYLVGSSDGGTTCGGALHMVDLSDISNPTFAGCHHDVSSPVAGRGATHDAQCVVYSGPDDEHRGKEICLSSNESALNISDVTDKSAPQTLAYVTFPKVAYAHQGWLTDDQRYFFMNDEADELNLDFELPGTRTLVWDVADLDDPVLVKEFYGTNAASDHNLYLHNGLMYQSNYIGGLRIIDVQDPLNPREVGFFDTVPWSENVPGFAGSWSNYPYFESGVIAVSSINEGLFLVRYNPPEAQ